MYRKTESYACDLCQGSIAEKTFPQLSVPLTPAERDAVRREFEAQLELMNRTAPAILRPMLALSTCQVPRSYAFHFCRACIDKLFGSLLENLKASCLEHQLDELRQRRAELAEQD